ncbi:NirD/YgiW/YdeI family stress tolerance protein [Maridesulfovibrio sp.]|uniref:NirD/YgiW/YdeI family stress tolerance protein n=1 Tax=Maridesulfovibrio sp. TaxID=2795000 RepID=UPI003B0083C5
MSVLFLLLLVIVAAACLQTLDFKSKDVTTVAEARVSGADTKAKVKGHIVRKINDNKYVFQDKTGEIIIDLSPKAGSLPVDANAEVEIEGRVEQDLVFAGIEAQKISVIN